MIVLTILISFIVFLVIIFPFYFGEGGKLLEGASVNDPSILEKQKKMLLEQYLREEAEYKKGDLTAREWSKRHDFFLMRYVDTARRLDYLKVRGVSSR